jgi:glycosyltransferase involved in cell wall biosynthesis
MKPRIFINIHYLEIGGAERALIGLLNALDPGKVDIDLFVNQHTGEFMKLIPSYVNLLPEIPKYTTIETPMKDVLKRGYLDIVAARLWAKFVHGKYVKSRILEAGQEDASIFHYVAKYTTPLLPSLKKYGKYDLAISFLNPHQIVKDKVDAKKKIAWIHTDYTISKVNTKAELPIWDAYDHIISISDDVTKTFLQEFPSLASKIIVIENIMSPKFVRDMANDFDVSDEFGGGITLLSIGRYSYQKNFDNLPYICKNLIEMIKLLSIGRFTHAKNYDNLPDICRRLVNEHGEVDLKWYIIGFGDEEPIRRAIAESGMEEHVILLGKKENPYPYIKACDIYVQPSRYEGKSVTVREAQMLCKPVVVTNYPTASSQIQDGIDGVIVPMDNEDCAKGIANVIADTALQQRLIDYLSTHDYGNEAEVEKIYKLLR